jgi:hypothetical protein
MSMNKTLTTVLVVVALVIVATVGYYFGYDHGWEKAQKERDTAALQQQQEGVNNYNNTPTPTPVPQPTTGAFHKDSNGDYWGTIILTGYLDIQKRVCNPGDMCGSTVDYAYFVFGNTDNEAIKEFTGSQSDNSFVAGDRVGIGCQDKVLKLIRYENFADSGEMVGEIKGGDYDKLLASTQGKPVQLKMTRELYTSGRGAPDCYSHFRNFDVL